jgi:small-conductance mechanosensitive channel
MKTAVELFATMVLIGLAMVFAVIAWSAFGHAKDALHSALNGVYKKEARKADARTALGWMAVLATASAGFVGAVTGGTSFGVDVWRAMLAVG